MRWGPLPQTDQPFPLCNRLDNRKRWWRPCDDRAIQPCAMVSGGNSGGNAIASGYEMPLCRGAVKRHAAIVQQ
jgi:hypothetical protein